jgi:hypothetical protein
MEERKSKVTWSGMTRPGGTADQETQEKLMAILDDIGVALEQEARISHVDRLLFPIFKKLEVAGVVTDENIFYIISPYGGEFARYIWSDTRNKPKPPDQLSEENRILKWVREQYGWTDVWVIKLGSDVLDLRPNERKDKIQEATRYEVEEEMKELDKQARLVRCKPVFEGQEFYIQKDLCFILMPFDPSFVRLYEEHIKPTLVKMGFRVIIAKDFFTSTPIINDIWRSINEASLIVADITGKNSNVFYELGIAHTVGKKSIILNQGKEPAPFDMSHMRYFTYTDNRTDWKELEVNLEKTVHATIG